MEQQLQAKYTRINALKTILITGGLAGALDAVAAIVVYQVKPLALFKFIASGAFGVAAFSEGSSMAWYGFLFHFIIAFSWTILFFFIYPKFPLLSKNRIVTGVIYGAVIWLVMNFVVLPLTAVKQGPITFKGALTGSVILMLMVGIPISIFTHRYYSRLKTKG